MTTLPERDFAQSVPKNNRQIFNRTGKAKSRAGRQRQQAAETPADKVKRGDQNCFKTDNKNKSSVADSTAEKIKRNNRNRQQAVYMKKREM